MTPSYRRRLYREFAIGLLLAAAGIYSVFRGGNWLLVAIGVIAPIAYFVILGAQIAISRCPRCRALIDYHDLRGPDAMLCPNCGVRLPSRSELENKNKSVVQQDTYVNFTSHLGNSFVAPSQWTAADKGDTFSLKSPDSRALIHAIMYTSDGSGTLSQFRETMVSGLLPDGATAWKASDWTPITLGESEAQKRELIPVPESDQQWRLYVVDGGKFYHSIVVSASNESMTLNGGLYENIVRTFKGVRQ